MPESLMIFWSDEMRLDTVCGWLSVGETDHILCYIVPGLFKSWLIVLLIPTNITHSHPAPIPAGFNYPDCMLSCIS